MTWQRDAGRLSQMGKCLGGGYVELIRSRAQGENWSKVLKEERRFLWMWEVRGSSTALPSSLPGLRIRPLLWSNNGGVQRQQRSALGAGRVPHHLSRMLGWLCWDARRSKKKTQHHIMQPSFSATQPGSLIPRRGHYRLSADPPGKAPRRGFTGF